MAKSTLQSIPVQLDEVIDLKIDAMAYDNSAVGRYKDFVVLVDRGAPGDELSVQITSLRPNYARAKIVKLKSFDSNYRIEPDCKLFKVCGGCQWQHVEYNKQLEQKNLLLNKSFSKLNLEEGVLLSIKHPEKIWNYRNKVQYPVRTVSETGRLKAGYFEWHSNELINVKYCPIQYSKFDQIIDTVRELALEHKIVAYDSKNKTGWLRHISVRAGFNTGEMLLTLVVVNDKLSRFQEFCEKIMKLYPELVGVCININTNTTNVIYGPKTSVLSGRGYFWEKFEGLKFKISATSFFQVNTPQAYELLKTINSFASLSGKEVILDAYCGVGLIALFLAGKANKVIGIEEVSQSIEDAKSSAKENKIKNAEFVFGRVENKIDSILEKENIDLLILDPPRAGCNKRILEAVLRSKINKIIYTSCNPNTLARDLEILTNKENSEMAFKVKAIQPVEMFPHTYHIECVVLLER